MKGGLFLSDSEWAAVSAALPRARKRKDGRGRPPRNPREVMNGILWVLFSGAPWHMLPRDKYPPYQTCHRYFQQWVRRGVMQRLLKRLITQYSPRPSQPVRSFTRGCFAAAKKGETRSDVQ